MAMAKAKAKAKGTGGGGRSKLITATKDAARAANLQRLSELESLIRRRLTTAAESFYDVGVALAEVVKRKLYGAADHDSFAEWLAATKMMSESQALKLMAIVKNVPREQAIAAGQERAYALIALSNATPEDDSAAELIARGVVGGQPAVRAPVRAIEAAARAQRAKAPKTPAAKARAKADAAIEKGVVALLQGGGVRATGVRFSGDDVRVTLSRAQVEKALAKG